MLLLTTLFGLLSGADQPPRRTKKLAKLWYDLFKVSSVPAFKLGTIGSGAGAELDLWVLADEHKAGQAPEYATFSKAARSALQRSLAQLFQETDSSSCTFTNLSSILSRATCRPEDPFQLTGRDVCASLLRHLQVEHVCRCCQ